MADTIITEKIIVSFLFAIYVLQALASPLLGKKYATLLMILTNTQALFGL